MHAKVETKNDYIYSDLQAEIESYAKQLTFNQIILMYDQITEAHKN